MDHPYYFGIDGERIGPLDESAIEAQVAAGTITRATLAWCRSMDQWKPVAEIPELTERLGPLLGAGSEPPPLPTATASPDDAGPPPLPPADAPAPQGTGATSPAEDSLDPSYRVPEGLDGVGSLAYHVVFWLFRPWRGRPSRVRRYVRQDPRRAKPIALASVLGLMFLFCLALASVFEAPDAPSRPQGPSGPAGPAVGGADVYRPMINAQRETDRIIDDVYRYNRDSFDQQSETYRRGNYDWYSDRHD